MSWTADKEMKKGDKFTIQGIRLKKDGTYTKRCKPGNETVWTVKKKYTSRRKITPAIYIYNEKIGK